MARRTPVLLLLAALAVAASLAAQPWQGPAAVVVEVVDEDGRPVAGAKLTARLGEGGAGPAAVLTDARGRALLSGLSEAEWYVEVSHQGYMLYAAYIRLRSGKKPEIAFSSQVNTATSWKPMTVRFSRATPESTRGLGDPQIAEAPGTEPGIPSSSGQPAPGPGGEPPTGPEDAIPDVARRPAPDAAAQEPPRPPVAPTERPVEAASEPVTEPTPEPSQEPAGEPTEERPVAGEEAAEPPPAEAPADAPAETPVPPLAEPPSAPAAEAPPIEPAVPPIEPSEEPAVPPLPAPTPEQPEPAVPEPVQPEPRETPPQAPLPQPEALPPGEPAAAGPAGAGPVPDYLGSAAAGTCSGCESGEWGVIAQEFVARRPDVRPPDCPGDTSGLAGLGEEFSAAASPRLDGYAGPLTIALTPGPLGLVEAGARAEMVSRLGPLGEPTSSCRVVVVVLPEGSQFAGYQYEAWDALGGGGCLADLDCPLGQARWLGEPQVLTTDRATFVYGIFSNRSTRRERRAKMTVFFTPAAGWRP